LEEADRDNCRHAHQLIEEAGRLIQPDFIQFAGDNVQHAREVEFALFKEITDKVTVPWYALVGDHDAHHDGACHAFRRHLGATHQAFSLKGWRFILLNTMEFRPLGMTAAQVLWFRFEVDSALERGEKVVVFQHHYPFKVCESFAGPGVAEWREIVQTRPVTAIFSGHTHYGQVANDGKNLYVATRSVGEPEGGPAGGAVVYLDGDDLALTYRSVEDKGPLVLITHPRQVILCTGGSHIVSGPDEVRARIWSEKPLSSVEFRIGNGPWLAMEPDGVQQFRGPIPGDALEKGEHQLEVRAMDAEGWSGAQSITFHVDRSARFTAVPRVFPAVQLTRFC
ncbi:MAG: metallophosphoesterase, partial [Verrucomicrobiales bacterium]